MCPFKIKLDVAFIFCAYSGTYDSNKFTSFTDCSRQEKVMPEICINIIHTQIKQTYHPACDVQVTSHIGQVVADHTTTKCDFIVLSKVNEIA